MDMDVMGFSGRAQNGWKGCNDSSKNEQKAPKFGKTVKFGDY
jgi:hypothetical protein